ncbi:MAG: hypothetical protein LC687_03785, partial [Actinobacteria bacterium]|nr:hypothetical protein [Actinomycetota bacterium]
DPKRLQRERAAVSESSKTTAANSSKAKQRSSNGSAKLSSKPAPKSPPKEDDDSESAASNLSDRDEMLTEDEEDEPEPKKKHASSNKKQPQGLVAKRLQDDFDNLKRMKDQTIANLKKKLAKLKEQHDTLGGNYNDILAEVKYQREELEDLSERYQKLLASSAGRKKKVAKSEAMIREIKTIVKRMLWRVLKFVGNDQQLMEASIKVMDHLQIKDCTFYEDDSAARANAVENCRGEWIATYGTDVRQSINEQRSYVQAEQKKLALDWQKGSEKHSIPPKDLPTVDEMYQVLLRNLETDDADQSARLKELFDWWLNHVGACAGNTFFSKKIRRTQQVSVARDSQNRLCVPSSTEAMAFLMYENCYPKWIEMH